MNIGPLAADQGGGIGQPGQGPYFEQLTRPLTGLRR